MLWSNGKKEHWEEWSSTERSIGIVFDMGLLNWGFAGNAFTWSKIREGMQNQRTVILYILNFVCKTIYIYEYRYICSV